MTKDGFKRLLSEKNEISIVEAERIIDIFTEGAKEALKQEDKLQITGVVTFEVKNTKPRTGTLKNANGELKPWSKEAGKKVSAKVSKAFAKEIVGE